MKSKQIFTIAIVAAAAIATILVTTGQAALDRPVSGPLVASGFIEAEEIKIGPETGGRIAAITVAEGNCVEAGQTLVRMDDAVLAAQITAAQASLAVAEAELAQAEAGARPEQIRQAEAALTQAKALHDSAHQAWQDAVAIRDNPQELNARIVDAQTQVAVAEAAVTQAEALKNAAEIAQTNYDDAYEAIDEAQEKWKALPEELRPPEPHLNAGLDSHLIPNRTWQAWVTLNTAKARLSGAQASLRDLLRMRAAPQSLDAQVDAARARYETTQAGVQQAEAYLAEITGGVAPETMTALAAQVAQAAARLETLQRQRAALTVTAPVGGRVLEIGQHAGELVAGGGTVLTLGNLDEVTLTVYVAVDRLSEVQIGQPATVSIESLPERTFTGTVVAIADEAEFTPRSAQTKEDRARMVFAVEIHIPNTGQATDGTLRPGLPADAHFAPQGES